MAVTTIHDILAEFRDAALNIKRVARVSVETMKIVNALPALNERGKE